MTTPWKRVSPPWALSGSLMLCACGGDGGEPEAVVPDASSDARDAEPAADYRGCEDLAPFELGQTARGANSVLEAVLLAASPAPPARYRNDWTVQLRAADGRPLDDVVLTHARPFMPLHGHDGGVQPVIEALAEPGHYQLDRLNLSMRGAWEIQLTASSRSAGDDAIVFHVCVVE